MKICHVIYIPRLSGAEILVRDMAIIHGADNNQISVLSLEPAQESFKQIIEELEFNNINLVVPKKKLTKLSRIFFLIQKLKIIAPDIIVAHSVIPSIYIRLALKLYNSSIPVISVLHDASQNDHASPYFRIAERLLKNPSCVVALTKTASNNYQKYFGSNSRVEIIPNGINIEKIMQSLSNRNSIRKKVFNCNNEIVFLQVGRFNQVKQQQLSIESFIKAYKNAINIKAKLFLAGLEEDKEYVLKLKKLVADAKLQKQIIFLGARSDIPDLLGAADIYLMPSLKEAHSIAFLEAMVSKITMVVSNIQAFEIGKKNPGVFYLQSYSSNDLCQMIIELSKRKNINRWNREVSELSIENTANKYMKIFHSLLKTA